METFQDVAKKLSKDFPKRIEQEFIPSGSVVFDAVLGGGIPLGTYIEIASRSGLGKSTAVLHFCKTACSLGKNVVYLDFEQGVNESQIRGIGIDKYLYDEEENSEGPFLWKQPVTFSDAEKIIDKLVDVDDLVYVVFDSITSILPDKLKDKSVNDIQPGLQARLTTNFLQKYKSMVRRSNVTFIFINQMRCKFNFRGRSTEEPAGGNAQKFFTDIRLRLSKENDLEKVQDTIEGEKKVPYGAEVGVWAAKNRYERPFIKAIATIIFGKGVSNLSAYYRWLKKRGKIKRKGSWYYIYFGSEDGEPVDKVQGKNKLLIWIKENKEEVKNYISENGGFLLIADEREDNNG